MREHDSNRRTPNTMVASVQRNAKNGNGYYYVVLSSSINIIVVKPIGRYIFKNIFHHIDLLGSYSKSDSNNFIYNWNWPSLPTFGKFAPGDLWPGQGAAWPQAGDALLSVGSGDATMAHWYLRNNALTVPQVCHFPFLSNNQVTVHCWNI